ncbi:MULTISPECIES: TetR/AcrR family transcriptional regulator [Novosphingobium]|uniref:TetR/AcrR family transcriptional regulator n=1 Tax=Novosphingobium sp. ST904 TaxID=1684385 RepID=UPI0006C8B494|nr:TetR/AcrR family transcriptional regulator [Novosphingobium sp. ST904]KPH61825.1 hypothetical protein ADT71_16565 [Novosphingobium sp. ST904]TCM34388.1 TetR family transcriptional regulator [Novosphingobium sp. ST904]
MDEATKPARRKRRSSQEVTRRLLEAAEEEFRRCGYAGATTAAIARRAESTEAQLFRTFPSKAALFQEAVFAPLDRHLERFNAEHSITDSSPDAGGPGEAARRENARLYVSELGRFLKDHAPLLMAALTAGTYGEDQDASARAIDSLNAYFERGAATRAHRVRRRNEAGEGAKSQDDGAQDGGTQPVVDPRLMVRVSFAAVLGNVLFRDMLFPAGLAGDDEIDAAMLDFMLHGTGSDSG